MLANTTKDFSPLHINFFKYYICFNPLLNIFFRTIPTSKISPSTPIPIPNKVEEEKENFAKEMKPSEDTSQPLWDTVWDAHLYFSGTLFILLVRQNVFKEI